MSKAEDRALEAYPVLMCYNDFQMVEEDINKPLREIYQEGYRQAEKDLLENNHETSWRLDEKLWKGIKDMEEASYQYMYDASNDWAYDIPTWKDVQDAFKAGSEWKEGLELSWKDIPEIFGISEQLKTSWWFRDNEQTKQIGTQVFWEEVLKRFNNQRRK